MTVIVQYPRAVVTLHARVLGEDITTDVTPLSVELQRRNHREADTCEVEFHATALAFNVQQVEDLWIAVRVGDVQSTTADIRDARFEPLTRFMGYADTVQPTHEHDKAPRVKISARDLSSLLRSFKPLPTELHPRFSDTLREALQRILDGVPSVRGLLTIDGVGIDAMRLAPLVGGRARTGRLPLENDASAWDAIERACGAVNRLASVQLDQLVISEPTPEGPAADAGAAALRFGGDDGQLLEVREKKTFQRNRRGVRVVGLDPITHERREGIYPPDTALPAHRRARGRRGRGGGAQPPERDNFAAPDGAATVEALTNTARTIYEQRSRGEIEIEVETPLLADSLLNLRNRDRVAIYVDGGIERDLRESDSLQEVAQRIRRRLGVDERSALMLARAAKAPRGVLFYVRDVTVHFDGEKSTGRVKVTALNLFLEVTR